MPEIQVQIDANGPSIEVEVTIGQPVRGIYRIFLWDHTAKKSEKIGEGLNYDAIADRFAIKDAPTQLDKKAVSWEYVVDLGPPPGSRRAQATVRIWQGSNELHTETATLSGNSTKAGCGYIRLVLGGN